MALDAPAAESRIFYGWWVAVAFSLTIFLSTGIGFAVGPFLKPVAGDHGIPPEDVIIDPLAMPIGAEPRAVTLFLETLHLLRDEFALCIEGLRAGIAANRLNEDLNDDMRRLLADVEQRHPRG